MVHQGRTLRGSNCSCWHRVGIMPGSPRVVVVHLLCLDQEQPYVTSSAPRAALGMKDRRAISLQM